VSNWIESGGEGPRLRGDAEIRPKQDRRRTARRRMSSGIGFAILLGMGLVGALPAKAEEAALQGNWTATKAERDGKPADDLVGHRLSFTGDRFEIRSRRT